MLPRVASWWETAARCGCPQPCALQKCHTKGVPEMQVWLLTLPPGTDGANGAATEEE